MDTKTASSRGTLDLLYAAAFVVLGLLMVTLGCAAEGEDVADVEDDGRLGYDTGDALYSPAEQAPRLAPGSDGETCVTVQGGGAVMDAHVWSAKPDKNWGRSQVFTAGKDATSERQALVRFDLSTVPRESQITSATVTPNVLMYGGADVEAHRVLAPWTDTTLTWRSLDRAYSSDVEAVFPATDHNPPIGNRLPVPKQTAADLTDLVEAWVDGTYTNNGLVLTRVAEGSTVFSSSDGWQGTAPKLIVCYVPQSTITLTDTCTTIKRGLLGEVEDTYVATDALDTNFGASTSLLVTDGILWTPPVIRYGLLRFDLDSLTPTKRIAYAKVTLRVLSGYGEPVYGSRIRNHVQWKESTVTMSNLTDSTDTIMSEHGGVDFPAPSSSVPNAPTSARLDLLVQGWVDGIFENKGIALWRVMLGTEPDPEAGGTTEFSSSESLLNVRPKLRICTGSESCTAEVSAGVDHTCARRTDGTVWCWGLNNDGQLGDGTTDTSHVPVEVEGLPKKAVEIDAGGEHTCARVEGGFVWCWGRNTEGQLGLGTATAPPIPSPSKVQGLEKDLSPAVEISAGRYHTCARKANGFVWCWGLNNSGQLGIGTTDYSKALPVLVTGLKAVEIEAGQSHTCARKADGTVWCWGANSKGQLGSQTAIWVQPTPIQVGGLVEAVEIAAGGAHTCARRKDGSVWCWGENTNGQVGDGTSGSPVFHPVQAGFLMSEDVAVEIAAGGDHSCSRLQKGSVWCWGANLTRQVGDGEELDIFEPWPVRVTAANTGVVEISLGGEWSEYDFNGEGHSCARTSSGSVWCWGNGEFGQLGGDAESAQEGLPIMAALNCQ